ncbi:MAG: hypothetical protein QOJ26_1176 [Thermoplasmata archaeon]|jgi:hypothetical protein|nr:hypothetical protein [Thermoplasmata archaeon]
MKTQLLIAATVLLTALAAIPSSQATAVPPPCQTIQSSCCFAPCCTVLTCPPPILRCPTAGTDTLYSLITLGVVPAYGLPSASANTNSNCSADACVSTNDPCNQQSCDNGTASCCDIDRASYDCTCQTSKPTAPQVIETNMALPTPHPFYQVNRDCTVTTGETYDCPSGFWDSTIYYTAGPVHVVADSCTIMCACMPLEVDAVPQVLG